MLLSTLLPGRCAPVVTTRSATWGPPLKSPSPSMRQCPGSKACSWARLSRRRWMPKLQASTAPKAFWNPALEGGSPIYHREVGYVALVAHRSLRCHKLSPRDHADVALIGEQTVNPRLQEPHLLVDGPAVCRGIGPDPVVDRQERFLGADRVGMDLQTGCMGFGHHVVGWARMPSVLRPMIWRLLRSTTVK